jgi:putative hydrolase of the HAD superfamily
MTGVLLFDLDETLVVEEPAAVAAFHATARFAGTQSEVDVAALAVAARARARELWCAAPTHDYCLRVGISSWEGLWCRFEGCEPNVRSLREWSPTYRREAWRLALADQNVDNVRLAEELGERFATERRARHEVFADVAVALSDLRESCVLALVTDGASCLQREKLAASGLSDYFDVVVVSAEFGVAKPDASIFTHVLEQLDADSKCAVMVGDSLSRDVDGAVGAGLGAVWVNRVGRPRPPHRSDLIEISTLSDLPAAIRALASRLGDSRDCARPAVGHLRLRRRPRGGHRRVVARRRDHGTYGACPGGRAPAPDSQHLRLSACTTTSSPSNTSVRTGTSPRRWAPGSTGHSRAESSP